MKNVCLSGENGAKGIVETVSSPATIHPWSEIKWKILEK